ncbi:MAG TPA: hypothetical protein VKH83_00690 [Methylomirabilota bacterium]|nr:hypothetical protein [Methylomirabilota bacterium]
MSKPRRRNQAPEGLVVPEHRYRNDARTRKAIALAATVRLAADPTSSDTTGRTARKSRRVQARAKKR